MNASPTILVSLTPDESAFARIRDACPGCEIRVGPWVDEEGQKIAPELMNGADILFCEIPPANFDEFDQLKWVQLTSAGYTQVLDLPILDRGIQVTNGLGNFDVPIAEWNMMMMMLWERDLLGLIANQRDKVWDRDARFQRDLFGSKIGFYGYGGIARETARMAKALNVDVRVLTRDGTVKPRTNIYCVEGTGDPEGVFPDRVYAPSQIEEFLSELDYFLITIPLKPSTEGLIGERELRMLKPSAVLINPARAKIIDEDVFVRCLEEKWIRGASLDVHYEYPLPPEHPLWEMPNLVLTPHVSGSAASKHFLERAYDIFEQNCRRFGAGEPMINELSDAQLRGE
jgi:phosphoglycerate dehydrogenase-like enzyme